MAELPPQRADLPQDKRALRQNKTAAKVRKMFPRGTRVESTVAFSEPGLEIFGTVAGHIPGMSEDGGRLIVLWDKENPFGGGPHVTNRAWAGGLLIVDPETGRGIVRPGLPTGKLG